MQLSELGWCEFFQIHWDQRGIGAPCVPARVLSVSGDQVQLHTGDSEVTAVVSRRSRGSVSQSVITGDWVAFNPEGGVVREVLPRRTAFVRQAAGRRAEMQIVAANVEVALLVMACTEDFNLRRLERYLVLCRTAGILPVLLLTKAGLCDGVNARVAAVQTGQPGLAVHPIDVIAKINPEAPKQYLTVGVTAVLLGSSGVGKSTLVNALLGEEAARIGNVRAADGRGRHITTRRELFVIPAGGLVMDTPGMRELQLWADGSAIEQVFDEILQLAQRCRFRDCLHHHEPGCAVREAVKTGGLDPDRLASFQSLWRETNQHGARRRESERREHGRRLSRAVRQAVHRKYGR